MSRRKHATGFVCLLGRACLPACEQDARAPCPALSHPQYLDPVNGSLVDAANATSSYDNVTSRCLNVVTYLNITFIYVVSDASLDSAPGYIDSVSGRLQSATACEPLTSCPFRRTPA